MEKKFTNMRDIVSSYANAMNLLRPETEKLHQRVAYLAYNIASEMNISESDKKELLYASLLYDVGVGMMPDKQPGEERYYFKDLAATGLGIIGDVQILKPVCEIFKIVDPETPTDETIFDFDKYKDFAEIIDVADRVAFMLDPKDAALNQVEDICDTISDLAGEGVSSSVVEAFLRFADKEYVWMEVLHQPEIFLTYISDENSVTLDDAIGLARFMSRIIDFRSSYTAMHSSGVAATAVRLAEIMGMSEDECKMMMIAGYLHDIGKLKVPKAVLEKNDKLTDAEFNIVKEYAYYTHLLLKDLTGFEQIGRWASLHHEKLNGYGYPFRLKADDIPMGARIIAIADIFSAVAEIRSYRAGMSKEEVIKTLADYVDSGAMSGYIVEILINNYDSIYSIRDSEVRREGARYFASSVDVD
ncbi:HD domain-containing protein [Lachnospiraceae bacterium NE2001]|nr:HD domain-containing protein [Lachnospiraceae bacterium NE2001]